MLDQKEIVQKIYIELVNDDEWIKGYRLNPDEILDNYGLTEKNKMILKRILKMH